MGCLIGSEIRKIWQNDEQKRRKHSLTLLTLIVRYWYNTYLLFQWLIPHSHLSLTTEKPHSHTQWFFHCETKTGTRPLAGSYLHNMRQTTMGPTVCISELLLPRSPWAHSAACTNSALIPTELNDAASRWATWPDLPALDKRYEQIQTHQYSAHLSQRQTFARYIYQ